MGNSMKRFRKNAQVSPQQRAVYLPAYGQPMVQQKPGQYGPTAVQMQQQVPYTYGPSYSNGSSMPRYPGPPPVSYPYNQNQSSPNENDNFISNLTGFQPTDVQQLRLEFSDYANSYGVIDREGFRKFYIASLLNTTWRTIEYDAEVAFRNFDVNQSDAVDFYEYITTCSRILRNDSQ